MAHAWRAGDLLTDLRRMKPRGSWLPWLAEREIPARTAQRLMALRRACPTEADAVDAGSMRAALARVREADRTLDELPLEADPVEPKAETIVQPQALPSPDPVEPRPHWWQRLVAALARLIGR